MKPAKRGKGAGTAVRRRISPAAGLMIDETSSLDWEYGTVWGASGEGEGYGRITTSIKKDTVVTSMKIKCS